MPNIKPIYIQISVNLLVFFNKYGEDKKITSEIELPSTLSMTHNLTQSELDKIIIQCTLEHRIQTIEMRESGWRFQRINTMRISFYKSGNLKCSSSVRVPLRVSVLINV